MRGAAGLRGAAGVRPGAAIGAGAGVTVRVGRHCEECLIFRSEGTTRAKSAAEGMPWPVRMERRAMRLRGSFSLLVLIYLIVGIFVAWKHDYINLAVLKIVVSALLAIVLWFLILLGVNLHIH
jgi:hypothetical protein